MSVPVQMRRGNLAQVKLTPPFRGGKNVKPMPPSEIAVRTPHKGGLRNTGGEELARLFGIPKR